MSDQLKRLDVGNRWQDYDPDASLSGENQKMKVFPVNRRIMAISNTGQMMLSGAQFAQPMVSVSYPSGVDTFHDAVEDIEGNLWGLFSDSTTPGGGAYTAKVYKSENVGSAWTLVYTHTASRQVFNIAAAPKRGTARVAFTARDAASGGTTYQVVVTVDNGDNWDVWDVEPNVATSSSDNPLIVWGSDSRLVVYQGGVAGVGFGLVARTEAGDVYFLEDGADDWTLVGSDAHDEDTLGYAFHHTGVGEYLFAIVYTGGSPSWRLVLSEDNGQTYTFISDADEDIYSYFYDGERLWVACADGGTGMIRYSDDLGGSWTTSHTYASATPEISAITVDPNNTDNVYIFRSDDAGSGNPVVDRSANRGSSWTIGTTVFASPREAYRYGHSLHIAVSETGVIYAYMMQQVGTSGAEDRVLARYSNDGGANWNATGVSAAVTTDGTEEQIYTRGIHRSSLGAIGIRKGVVDVLSDSSLGSATTFSQPNSVTPLGSAYDADNDVLYILYEDGECWKITQPHLFASWGSAEQLPSLAAVAVGDIMNLALVGAP